MTSKGRPSAARTSASSPPLAEEEGVSAFEPDDELALPGLGDQDVVDLVLGLGVMLRSFAHVDQFTGLGGMVQEGRVYQPVVYDNVRRA